VEASGGQVGDQADDVLGELGTSGQLGGQGVGLGGGGDLSGEQQPEQALRGGLLILGSGSLGQEALEVGDGVSTETDSLDALKKKKEKGKNKNQSRFKQ
jgi:hypothetical protein